MCKSIFRKICNETLETASAGAKPSGELNLIAIETLQKSGYETTNLRSKSFDDVASFEPDIVVTVCDSAAKEPCPVWLGGVSVAHWPMKDPSQIKGSPEKIEASFSNLLTKIRTLAKEVNAASFKAEPKDEMVSLFQSLQEKIQWEYSNAT